MPKSRKRKPTRTHQQRARRARHARPEPQQMGPWLQAMFEAADAEARGDALGALDVMERLPAGPDGTFFWRPWRAKQLFQIAMLGPILPRWVTSRWMLNQAMGSFHDSHRARARRALDLAVELRGGVEALPGVDELDALGRVEDRDWVFRQLLLYELGALDHFVRAVASPDLVVGADSIREWARAPMGGFRLVDSQPAETTWLDLATGEQHPTPNIGSAVLNVSGEHVIGRLVPIEQGTMFETQPLTVPETVAQRVAEAPSEWLEVLRAAGAEQRIQTHGLHYQCLLTDVPAGLWLPVLLPGLVPSDDTDLTTYWSEVARAVLDAAADVLHGRRRPPKPDEVHPWPLLATAFLDPCVLTALPDVLRPADAEVLRDLAGRLAVPAATVCHELVEGRRDAA